MGGIFNLTSYFKVFCLLKICCVSPDLSSIQAVRKCYQKHYTKAVEMKLNHKGLNIRCDDTRNLCLVRIVV